MRGALLAAGLLAAGAACDKKGAAKPDAPDPAPRGASGGPSEPPADIYGGPPPPEPKAEPEPEPSEPVKSIYAGPPPPDPVPTPEPTPEPGKP